MSIPMLENERQAARRTARQLAVVGAQRMARTAAATAGGKWLLWGVLALLLMIPLIFAFLSAVLSVFTASTTTPTPDGEFGEIQGVKYAEIINREAARNGVDPALVAAIIEAESSWDPHAGSRKGARGLMQVMPFNAKGADLWDPEENIRRGTEIIASHLRKYDGNLDLALAAYNAGGAAVAKYDGIPPYAETQAYVQKVKKAYTKYQAQVEDGKLVAVSGGGTFTHPVPKGTPTSGYGYRGKEFHTGQDWAAKEGTPVYAAADGMVVRKEDLGDRSYGTVVQISHGDGLMTLYAHMYPQDILVEVGDTVKKGQRIGSVGNYGRSTGPHLHFEVLKHNQPKNPLPFLKK